MKSTWITKFTFLTLAIFAVPSLAAPIRIATEGGYPPFNQLNLAGELEGYDVDVAKAICQKIKRECVFMPIPWEGTIPGLLSKKFDVIVSSMSITPERAEKVLFTQNYYRLGAVLVSRKDKKIAIEDKGIAVGVQRGATYERFAAKLNPTWNLKVYDKAKDHNQDLKVNRLQAVLGQQVVMATFIKENPQFEVKAGPMYDEETLGVGAGIAFRKDDKKLAKQFDDALTELKRSGELKTLASKYFDHDISGPIAGVANK